MSVYVFYHYLPHKDIHRLRSKDRRVSNTILVVHSMHENHYYMYRLFSTLWLAMFELSGFDY